MRWTFFLFLFVFFLLGFASEGVHPPAKSKLLFYDGAADAIFLVSQQGRPLKVTASIEGVPQAFSPSPDGKRLAVAVWSRRNQDQIAQPPASIYVVNIDGTNPINLTHAVGGVWDTKPAWSPDGRQIAFTSNREGPDDLLLMNPDGSGVQNLTKGIQPRLNVAFSSPNWSPDGQQIAFTAILNQRMQIYTINRDGTGLKHLLTDALDPVWSPDGKLIVFDRKSDLYRLDLQSNRIKRLTHTQSNRYPLWLPDGSGLLFFSNTDRNAVWYVSADGGKPERFWTDFVRTLFFTPYLLTDSPQAVSSYQKYATTWANLKEW